MNEHRWGDPIGQWLALQDAVKDLCGQRTVNDKLAAATEHLRKFQAEDFPDAFRPRFNLLMDARARAIRSYIGGQIYDFGNAHAEHQALKQAVLDLYAACLLDLGASGDRGMLDIAYPK